MPARTKCHVPGCTFEGNHGFTDTVGGMTMFYHPLPGDTHRWYSVYDEKNDKHVYSHDALDLFNRFVVPLHARHASCDPGFSHWVDAWRAELSNKPREAQKHFALWRKANNI